MAVLWWHRATPEARLALPQELRRAAQAVPLVVGGLLRYRRGPVGPYDEIFAAPVFLRGGRVLAHVPFMAVDSAASVTGGRRNWALPKEPASFTIDDEAGATAAGEDWTIRVAAVARPRAARTRAAVACVQLWPDGVLQAFTVRMAGPVRRGHVELEHTHAAARTALLQAGRHAAVTLEGHQFVTPPRRI